MYVKDIKELIEELGGQAYFSGRFDIPYRTVQNWYRGERKPPDYVYHMLLQLANKTKDAEKCDEENYKAELEIQDLYEKNIQLNLELNTLMNSLNEVEKALDESIRQRERLEHENKGMRDEIKALKEILYGK